MKTNEIRELLESLGYAFVVKDGDWVRCAVSGNGEQWLGKGLDEDTAIQDACNQMFPSQASRQLLERALDPPISETDAHTIEIPDEPEPSQETLAGVLAQGNQTPTPNLTEPVVEPEPEPAPKTEPPKVVAEVSGVVIKPKPTRTYVAPPDPEPEEPKINRQEALELVEGIHHEMMDNFEDVARMSPQYQRLHMSSWIFRARAVEEELPEEAVIEAVHRIARRLTDWCKVLWPGSIRALQVYTQPTHALDGLFRYKTMPKKWSEAADMVDEHLTEELAKAGRDELGWNDYAYLRPEAPNPDRVLEEAVTKIEAVMGELGGPLDDKKREVSGSAITSEIEELVLAAHLLRWVRKTANAKRWGVAMGALRWACRQGRRGAQSLSEVLSDTYKPEQPWAALLGRDPEINRKNRLRRKVKAKCPEKGWLEEDLMGWLQDAFQVFTNPEIAKLSEAVHAEILDFTNADFADADRRTRSRLHKLQSILRTRSVDLSQVEIPDDDDVDDGEEETAETPTRVDPTQQILEEVQKITEGKSILFVTNRPEERLHRDLERNLKAKVHYKVGDTSRTMKPIIQGVSADRYDMVLMAAAFNNHNADTALCRATKAEGLPYIRVQKGRLASTIRSIGRAYNVQSSNGGQEDVAHTG